MITFRHLLPALATAALLASCAQRLPDVADFDRCYQRAEQLAQGEFQDLDRRRSSGQLDDASYQQQKAALKDKVNQRAIEMAWTTHSLETTQRASMGIPTPGNPQDIVVPQAGTLATGGDYRRFNDQDTTATGTTSDTVNGMSRKMTNSGFTPGAATQSRSRSGL